MAIEIRDLCPLMGVWDMPTTVRFYRDLLGFEMESRSPTYAVEKGEEQFHWCTMHTGNTYIMLNTEYDEGERPAERPTDGQGRFGTWFYYRCEDLDGAYAKLQAAGVACQPPSTASYGFRVITFRDPDGRNIALQWPL